MPPHFKSKKSAIAEKAPVNDKWPEIAIPVFVAPGPLGASSKTRDGHQKLCLPCQARLQSFWQASARVRQEGEKTTIETLFATTDESTGASSEDEDLPAVEWETPSKADEDEYEWDEDEDDSDLDHDEETESLFDLDIAHVMSCSRSCVCCFSLLHGLAEVYAVDAPKCLDPRWNPTTDEHFIHSLETCVQRQSPWYVVSYSTVSSGRVEIDIGVRQVTRTGHQVTESLAPFYLSRFVNCTKQQDSDLISVEAVPGFALSNKHLDECYRWVQQCTEQHDQCPKTAVYAAHAEPAQERAIRVWPRRLLKIEGTPEAMTARLVATVPSHDYRYITLSHSWGGQTFQVLTSANHEDFCHDIPLQRLTKTFHEAATFCCLIGVQYLWIDSLCIIQSGDDDHDKMEEITKMEHVYANCFLNVAAASSNNGHEGLFRPPNPMAHGIGITSSGEVEALAVWHRESSRDEDAFKYASPLMGRGWVVQETFLSPRTIYFTDTHPIWSCRTTYPRGLSDVGEYPLQPPKLNIDTLATVEDLDSRWQHLAIRFSSTAVTQPEDRSRAILGLVSRFERRYMALGVNTKCVNGCWTHRVASQLLSEAILPLGWTMSRLADTTVAQPYKGILPTWSWLQKRLGIRHFLRVSAEPMIQLVRFRSQERNGSTAQLDHECRELLMSAPWCEKRWSWSWGAANWDENFHATKRQKVFWILCGKMGSHLRGLLCVKVGKSRDDVHILSRIGIFDLDTGQSHNAEKSGVFEPPMQFWLA